MSMYFLSSIHVYSFEKNKYQNNCGELLTFVYILLFKKNHLLNYKLEN